MKLLWTAIVVVIVKSCQGKCRNACSGHGFCNTFNVCQCQRGFQGGDCSQVQCPQGKAWGIVTGTDVAHSLAECSGRGICDRTTGVCTCQLGFQGSACQQVACSSSCSGRGQCLTMQQLAATPLIAMNLYNQPPYQYSPYVMWDADMIQGCLCDGSNTGFDCALKQCHLGDDPMTTGQTEEIQLIQCTASYLRHQVVLQFDNAITAGSFVLNFGTQRTDPISFNAPAANAQGTSMTEMLQSLSTIPSVSVTRSVTPNSITWDIVFPPTATEQHIFRPTWRVVEVQQFFCAADSGFMTITYGSQAFPNIPFSASATTLQTTLQTYYKIGAVTVSYSTGTTLCSTQGNYVTVAFTLMHDRNNVGDLPALLIDATNQNQPNALAWGLNAPVVDKQAIEIVKGIDTCYVPEVQSLACCATSGFFSITFEGRTLSNLPFDIAATELKRQLLATFTQLLEIDVVYSSGSVACSLLAPANVISVTFAVVTTNGPTGNGVLSKMTTDIANGGVSGLAHTSPNLLRLSATATQVVRGARCIPLSANYATQPTAQIVSNVIQGGGAFTIAFRGATTLPIQAAASTTDVAKALLRLPTIKGMDVTFTSGEACSTPPNIIRLNFTGDFGILPSVSATPTTNAVGINVYTGGSIEPTTSMASVSCTKESLECSGRGTCDAALTGACTCFSGYTASDGRGNPASAIMRRDDCGAPIITVSSCPGDVPCSGHGICSGPPSYACTCAKGWRNGDCSQRLCPLGLSWFAYPSGNNLAHRDMIECSGVGSCDRATGTCSCQAPFKGGACEQMACGGVNTPCSGGGQCLTLSQIAPLATVNGVPAGFTYGADPNNPSTWDANKIQSCVCDALHTGYDCSQLNCPYGDDPNTYLDVMEVQYVRCIASSGTFALTFRGLTTSDIAWNADLTTVQAALNIITSGVTVQFNGANTAACSTSGVVIGITFLLDYGALPCIIPNNALLADTVNGNGQPGSGTLNVACGGAAIAGFTSVVGTRENALCSNHGVCDRTTGSCVCDPFFASSDGLGGPGTRGDCGYRKQFNDQKTSYRDCTISHFLLSPNPRSSGTMRATRVLRQHVVGAWKATLASKVPQTRLSEWAKQDGALHKFLQTSIPEALQHTGEASFDEHLVGVQTLLRVFGADEDVCTAGLFHSIYGTEGFQGYKFPITQRPQIRSLIGPRAERLAWMFCVVDRHSFDQAVFDDTKKPTSLTSRLEFGRFQIPIDSEEEWLDFMELVLADWMDQVEGAAKRANPLFEWDVGHAWSYRRTAYHAMGSILGRARGDRGARIEEIVHAIYDSEPQETRHLVQEVTPPMSTAAKEAREALASQNL